MRGQHAKNVEFGLFCCICRGCLTSDQFMARMTASPTTLMCNFAATFREERKSSTKTREIARHHKQIGQPSALLTPEFERQKFQQKNKLQLLSDLTLSGH